MSCNAISLLPLAGRVFWICFVISNKKKNIARLEGYGLRIGLKKVGWIGLVRILIMPGLKKVLGFVLGLGGFRFESFIKF